MVPPTPTLPHHIFSDAGRRVDCQADGLAML
jgi:hypothetical protein